MKFLKLELTDFNLYNIDENADSVDYLESNVSAFKKLYFDQGEEFWLRHLLTLREYFYILIRARFEHEHGQCLHWLINPMEKAFIQIHKLILKKGFEDIRKSFKNVKRNIKKTNLEIMPYLTHKEKWQLITSCSVKLAYKSLFGTSLGNSKATSIKTYFAIDLYKHFCKTAAVLLARYETATDIAANNNMEYWKPFPHWSKENYEVELFENYLARVYKGRLSELILVPDAYQIFHYKHIHKCCKNFIEIFSSKILEGNNGDFFKQKVYQPCNKHGACYVRLVHNEDCQNPHFCTLDKTSCIFTCDTDIYEKNLKLLNNEKYWKSHSVSTYPSLKSNYRDASTLTETNGWVKNLEQYPTHTVGYDWDDDNELPFWRELPPDFANFAKQLEKKEKTKTRLRDKLSKKAKTPGKDENSQLSSVDISNPFEDFSVRSSMFYHAQALFRDELGDELLCKLLKDKIGKSDMSLVELLEGKYEIEDLCCKQVSTKTKNKSTGWNVPCNWKFLENLKKLHIRKKLGIDDKEPSILEIDSMEKVDTEKIANVKVLNNNPNLPNGDINKTSNGNILIKKKGKQHNKKVKGNTSAILDVEISIGNSIIKQIDNNININSDKPTKSCKIKETSNECIKKIIIKSKAEIGIKNESLKNNDSCTFNFKSNIPLSDKKDIVKYIQKAESLSNCIPIEKDKQKDIISEPLKSKDEILEHINNEFIPPINDKIIKDKIAIETLMEKPIAQLKLDNDAFKGNKSNDVAIIQEKEKSSKFRICAYCGKLEPTRHSFKKCKLCKEQNFKMPRYYCSRICQTNDWREKHKNDHKDSSIT